MVRERVCVYVSIFGYYQVHVERGFRSGLSSRTSPAETIRFNLRARSFSNNSARVFPSFTTTLNRESGCTRTPYLARPLNSIRLYCLGPLVTQASALARRPSHHQDTQRITEMIDFSVPTIIFLGSIPFNIACALATTSIFRIRLLARFSLNVICKMAESIGFPET
jgi:hypothetical protein